MNEFHEDVININVEATEGSGPSSSRSKAVFEFDEIFEANLE